MGCPQTAQVPTLREAVDVAITPAMSKAAMARLMEMVRHRLTHRTAVASPATSFKNGLVPAFACERGAAVQVMAKRDAGFSDLASQCNSGVSHPCSHTCLRVAVDRAFQTCSFDIS